MKKVTEAERQEIDRLAALPDEAIDTRNIPEITDWTGAERGRFYRPIKQQITLRMDADILAWFRAQGGKYQSQINSALREYVDTHRTANG
jgi:uncharacterized protein (DUF4415 family)